MLSSPQRAMEHLTARASDNPFFPQRLDFCLAIAEAPEDSVRVFSEGGWCRVHRPRRFAQFHRNAQGGCWLIRLRHHFTHVEQWILHSFGNGSDRCHTDIETFEFAFPFAKATFL